MKIIRILLAIPLVIVGISAAIVAELFVSISEMCWQGFRALKFDKESEK